MNNITQITKKGDLVFPCDNCHEKFGVSLSFGIYYYRDTVVKVKLGRTVTVPLTKLEKFYKVNSLGYHKNQYYHCAKCANIDL